MSIAAALWTVPGGGIFSRTFLSASARNTVVDSETNSDAAFPSSGVGGIHGTHHLVVAGRSMGREAHVRKAVFNTSNVSVLSIAKTTKRFPLSAFIFAATQCVKAFRFM